MSVFLWFKRDLRLTDHPALALAAGRGPVLPVYIVEPELWAQPDASGRHWAFLRESLEDLATRCPLVTRVGDAVSVLEDLCAAHGITEIVSHEETGNGWSYDRDRTVSGWCKAKGIVWTELPQSGVVRRLESRDGWAARREGWLRAPLAEAPPVTWLTSGSDPLPDDAQLGLDADPCPGRQLGGRAAADERLETFLSFRGQTYRKAMSSPLDGEDACSRLSPYLAFGVMSGREAAQAAERRRRLLPKGARDGWAGSLSSFAARLAWRDHFMQKLEDEPRIEFECMHGAYAGMRGHDPVLYHAWATGQTGLPFVDACMRYLLHTGWLNFRMRSMLMAVASYHLWLDWRETGLHLARAFTDYEPGIHWSQTQMQSGTTGMNTVRIYNPIKQGYDQDPDGVFTRKWVPELRGFEGDSVHEPWKLGGVSGYPAPVVDVAAAAKQARERIFAVRRGDAFHAEARAIVKKHASRKKDRGFQRDPLTKDTRQLGFDF